MELLNRELLGNGLPAWLSAGAVTLVVLLALLLIRFLAGTWLRKRARATPNYVDDLVVELIVRSHALLIGIVSIYAGSLLLVFPDNVEALLRRLVWLALILQAGLWGTTAIRFLLKRERERRLEEDPGTVTTLNAIGFLGRLLLWSIVLLLALDNFGVNITALVAGLGIGGIAVALAVQNILGDLFASLSIVLDKPFVVGDFLIIGEYMGNVENVGLKTTRFRSLSGEQLVFSNNDLLSSRIRNYGRMFERRVVFGIGVVYQTGIDKLKEIPRIIRAAVEAQENTRFDRSHFKEYGDFSLNFETVYYVLVPEYGTYMDIQQAINLRIFERFAEEGIEFAYPTRTLYMAGEASSSPGS